MAASTDHHYPHLKHALVADQGFDSQELAFLALCRRLFEAMVTRDQAAWARVYRLAERQNGRAQSEPILRYTKYVVEAMRQSRASVFNYSKDSCLGCRKAITPEERLLVQCFHAIRRGHRSRAAAAAMMLCEGNDSARLFVSLEMLDFALQEGV